MAVDFEPFLDHSYAKRDWDGAVRADEAGGVESPAVIVRPVQGARLTEGRLPLTANGEDQPYAEVGDEGCATTSQSFRSGYLDVRDVKYDGIGQVNSFAADMSLDCGNRVRTGQVRLASTVPYVSVLRPPRGGGQAYPGGTANMTTTFTNDGTRPVTPSPATLGTFYPSDDATGQATIAADGCADTTMEPGDTCTVKITSPPGSVQVQLSVPALDGLAARLAPTPVVVADLDVTQTGRPSTVSEVSAAGAVDGNAVKWQLADDERTPYGYVVGRRTGDAGWVELASYVQALRYADTTAPAGVPSTYRITPRGSAGPDPTGSDVSAPTTPVRGWAPPAGARTFASVAGGPVTDAVSTTAGGVHLTVRANGLQRWQLEFRGETNWRVGRIPTGPERGALRACLIEQMTANGLPECTELTGALTIYRVALRADGTPAELAATFTGTGDTEGTSGRVDGIVVIGSSTSGMPGYLSAAVAPRGLLPTYVAKDSWDGLLSIPESTGQVDDFGVVLRNLGGAPVTPERTSVVSSYATSLQSNWSASAGCLHTPIAAGGSCSTSLRFTQDPHRSSRARATWTTVGGQPADLVARADRSWDMPRVFPRVSTVSGGDFLRADLAGEDPRRTALTYHCRLDARPWQVCGAITTFAGLGDGPHTFTVYAETEDHRISDWSSTRVTIDHTGPVSTITSPSVDTAVLTTSARVSWRATDAAGSVVVSTQSRRRSATLTAGYGGFSYGAAGTGASATATPAAGTEQCWSVRGTDEYGNTGAWSAERCLVAPVDDRRLAARGFARRTSGGVIGGTVSSAARTGSTLTLSRAQARQVGVVVSTCPGCGSIGVYLAGARIGTVSTNGAARTKVVRWLPRLGGLRTGQVQLRALGHQRVTVDGVLIRHR